MVAKNLEIMSVQIFKNKQHQQLFDKQGFIVLPFLSELEIQDLTTYFDETHPIIENDVFFSDSYSSDFEFKKKASDKIVEVFARSYENYFFDYKPFGGSFLFKTPGSNSELAAHQDWTIVDETKDIALNCWVPLCDITPKNGALMILPGSHFGNYTTLRAPTLPFFFTGHEELIHRNLTPFFVPAGTAIILNQSVIHYSQPNTSNEIRKAITAGVKNNNAQMFFHYKVPNEAKLEIFKEEDEFLIQFDDFARDIMERPKRGELVGDRPYIQLKYTKIEMEILIRKMKEKAGFSFESLPEKSTKKGFFNRLFQR
jgi:hypothetical protein